MRPGLDGALQDPAEQGQRLARRFDGGAGSGAAGLPAADDLGRQFVQRVAAEIRADVPVVQPGVQLAGLRRERGRVHRRPRLLDVFVEADGPGREGVQGAELAAAVLFAVEGVSVTLERERAAALAAGCVAIPDAPTVATALDAHRVTLRVACVRFVGASLSCGPWPGAFQRRRAVCVR
jgi:hypothetical protein